MEYNQLGLENLRQNEQFSVIKSSFYLMRFLFYTTFKYAKNE